MTHLEVILNVILMHLLRTDYPVISFWTYICFYIVFPIHTYRLSGVCQSDKNGVGAGVEVPYQGGWLDRGSITSGTACQNNA